MIDGQESQPYDGVLNFNTGAVQFDSAGRLHYFALRGNTLLLVDDKLQ